MTKVNFMSSASLQHGRQDGNKAEEVSLNETMLDPGPLQSTQTREKLSSFSTSSVTGV